MTDDNPTASVAPMPGIASDREIMKQAIEGLRDDIASMKRSQTAHTPPPQPNGHVSRGQIVNLVLGALLTATVGFAGVSYWRSTDRLDLIEETARAADRKVDQILKEDTGRRAYVDARIAELDRRTAPIEIIIRDVARLEKSIENLDRRLTASREERLADNSKIVEAVNASKTELALLRQELQQTRSLIEGQRPMLRRPSMLWGGGTIMLAGMRQNKAQNNAEARTASEEIADSIDEDRNELSRMRGVLRDMRDALEAMDARDQEDDQDVDPEDGPGPERAGPRPRDVETQSAHRSKPSRRSSSRPRPRKRSYRAGNSFTRALHRAFGRPYYRGRYWGSFRRQGIFR